MKSKEGVVAWPEAVLPKWGIETGADVIQNSKRPGASWTQLTSVSTWASGSGKLRVNCARRSLLKGASTIIQFLQKTRWAHRIATLLSACALCNSLTSWHICALEGMIIVTIKRAAPQRNEKVKTTEGKCRRKKTVIILKRYKPESFTDLYECPSVHLSLAPLSSCQPQCILHTLNGNISTHKLTGNVLYTYTNWRCFCVLFLTQFVHLHSL
jgi:hypothetical protein